MIEEIDDETLEEYEKRKMSEKQINVNEMLEDFKKRNIDFSKLKAKYNFEYPSISYDSIVNNPNYTRSKKILLIVFNLGWRQKELSRF